MCLFWGLGHCCIYRIRIIISIIIIMLYFVTKSLLLSLQIILMQLQREKGSCCQAKPQILWTSEDLSVRTEIQAFYFNGKALFLKDLRGHKLNIIFWLILSNPCPPPHLPSLTVKVLSFKLLQ